MNATKYEKEAANANMRRVLVDLFRSAGLISFRVVSLDGRSEPVAEALSTWRLRTLSIEGKAMTESCDLVRILFGVEQRVARFLECVRSAQRW